MKRIAGTVLALAAIFASFSAAALGLGQIEVKSKIGQPLVAEIPIVSGDPTELEQLQAGLASPETFARIGLRPPIGLIADLQFTQALDARGNPVIRVTTTQPVNEPLLTFLLEVDWGQGRLVREYSALIDTPRTVSAPLQPEIATPTVDAPALIERPAEAIAAEPQPEPAPNELTPNEALPAEPTPEDAQAIAPRPVVAAPSAAPISRPAAIDGSGYEVRRDDTLSDIAAHMGSGGTLDQTMIALLRANPDAFIAGNINRLKAGAVLRVPGSNELTELDAQQASAIVHSQIQEWRASRRAAPQPAEADVAASSASATNRVTTASNSTPSAARVAGARLEIVPPGASDATKAGTQSGINAGGEGAMLQQELTQTKETLAAREAESQELKTRVAELEKLQQQQAQLIAMKDTELAAAQQRLAQTQKQQTQASVVPWVIGLVGALVLGGLIAWLLRRRDNAAPKFRAPGLSTAPSLADAFAPKLEPKLDDEPVVEAVVAAPARTPEPPTRITPAWHTGAAASNAQRDLLDPETRAAHERLELARAYLDLGDLASARQLLGEIVINGDHGARQQATRMLRELE
ncbi:MAG TPA: FimV/HubP family polar landmark protein [Lysobacter sp.]|nr:FimV/HubP family polar landmark protein [Lysobacter sp.]